MKQNTALFLKTLASYYLSCIVCTLILSLFCYFEVINSEIYMNTLYGASIIISVVACLYLVKKAEKKTLFYIIGLLLLILAISLITSFSLSNVLRSGIRMLISFLCSFVILIRK